MKEDLQLFIIWSNGRQHEAEILADIKTKFDILKTYEISWSQEKFPQNLARFYGKNLRKGRKKIRECGTNPFLIIAVRDPSPQYYDGKNVNTTSSKYHYRQIFGGGYMVHASDNMAESFENFLLLTGENIANIKPSNSSEYFSIKNDLIGTNGWQNLESLQRIISMLPETNLDTGNEIWTIKTSNPDQTRRIINPKRCLFRNGLYSLCLNGKLQKIRIIPSF